MVLAPPKPYSGTDPEMGKKIIDKSNLLNTALGAKKSEKQKCQERGGSWDEKTQTCILVNKDTAVKPPPATTKVTPPPGTVETFTSEKTGRASGVTMPDGRTFLGLSPDEVNKIAQGEAARTAMPANAAPVGTAQAQARQLQQQQQAALQLGQLTPEQMMIAQQQVGGEAPIDWSQALTAGVVQAGVGAAGGAGIGAVFGGGAGAIPGAIIGLLGGFANGIRSNIKSQQSGEIGSANEVLTQGKSNMRQLRMLTQADPANAERYIEDFNDQLALIYAAERKLQLETQGDLNKFMDDGTKDKAKFELVLMPGGYAEIQMMRMQETLMSGIQLTPEQVLMQLQQEGEIEE